MFFSVLHSCFVSLDESGLSPLFLDSFRMELLQDAAMFDWLLNLNQS